MVIPYISDYLCYILHLSLSQAFLVGHLNTEGQQI